MVMHWLEMIKNKSQDQDNNKLVSFTDSYDISINIINQISHPLQAKWKLKNIFIENLELPNYLEDFMIGKA